MNALMMRLKAIDSSLLTVLAATLALVAVSVVLLTPTQRALALSDADGLETPPCYSFDDADDSSDDDSDLFDDADGEDRDNRAIDDDLDSDDPDDGLDADDDSDGPSDLDDSDDESGDPYVEDGEWDHDEIADLYLDEDDDDPYDEGELEDESDDEGESDGEDDFYADDDDEDDPFGDDDLYSEPDDEGEDLDGEDHDDYDCGYDSGSPEDDSTIGIAEPSIAICPFDEELNTLAEESETGFLNVTTAARRAGHPADAPRYAGSARAGFASSPETDTPASLTSNSSSASNDASETVTAETIGTGSQQNDNSDPSGSPIAPLAALGSTALALIGGRRMAA